MLDALDDRPAAGRRRRRGVRFGKSISRGQKFSAAVFQAL
jgi:hypothetical protein